jgi:hypothetical protein
MVSRLGRQFKRADLAIGLGSNLQPCGGRLRHEVVQPDEGRCRGPRGSLALLTEDVQHRAELAQGLLARLLDGEEGAAGLFGDLLVQMERHPGLHVDQGEMMPQGVVELTGDAKTLLAGSPPLLLLPDPDLKGASIPIRGLTSGITLPLPRGLHGTRSTPQIGEPGISGRDSAWMA